MAARETTEKYNKALADITELQGRIAQFEDTEKAKVELEGKLQE